MHRWYNFIYHAPPFYDLFSQILDPTRPPTPFSMPSPPPIYCPPTLLLCRRICDKNLEFTHILNKFPTVYHIPTILFANNLLETFV